MSRSNRWRITRRAGRLRLSAWAGRNATLTAYSTLVQTFTNGARTGLTPITIAFRPIAIRKGRRKERGERRAAVRGGIRRKCRAAQRGRAFLRNFSMRITDSESRATSKLQANLK